MSTEQDIEFQLEMLKLQIKHQEIWSSVTLLIAVEFATFISIATTYLSFGLTSGSMFYVILSAISIVVLYVLIRFTVYYFQREETQNKFDEGLEKDIQRIRDKFITRKTEQPKPKDTNR